MIHRVPMGRKNQFLLLGLCIATVTTIYYFAEQEKNFIIENVPLFYENVNTSSPAYIIDTPGCKIPNVDPFDKSVLKYIKNPTTMKCSDKLPLIQSDQRSIWIDEDALKTYKFKKASDIECCYADLNTSSAYLNNINQEDAYIQRFFTHCKPFKKSAQIFSEFVEVICKVRNKIIYRDYHAFIVPKTLKSNHTGQRKQEEVSVLIVGVDTVSRLNLYRQMPRTQEFLQFLDSIEFLGYNKVHDNTFSNLVPLFTGYSVQELRELCWANDSVYFDDCPWIWKRFSSKGYFTALAEDLSFYGTFNSFKSGFLQPPSDYYLRPFISANEVHLGHHKLLNMKYCIGARFTSEVLMDYALKFTANMTLQKKKFWSVFWESSVTHDFLNVPVNNDLIFLMFLKSIQEYNVLNSTVLIFMSDHGMRWGAFRETYQGRLEESLPFLYLVFPDWFKKKYSLATKNINQNKHRLTTHFDVHETMKDLLNLDSLEDKVLKWRISTMRHTRGISLFLPIPENRTCESAGIQPIWCSCQKNQKVSTTDKTVVKAANLSLKYLNSMMKNYKECAQLKLNKILSAQIQKAEEKVQTNAKSKFWYYVVSFVTEPGLAKFEAVVRHRLDTNEMTVFSDISRINTYNSQSKCVANYRLRLYCFCV